ncbi:DUF3987 domain-containing protein [Sneathiella chungangensis]|nr:DUF3987 domain-containing protein [Sneathiella chungangensis]
MVDSIPIETKNGDTDPIWFKETAPKLAGLGYLPVPLAKGSKGPRLLDWPKYKFGIGDEEKHSDLGCGIICGQVIALDLDIPDLEILKKVCEAIGVSNDKFYDAPERIGSAPKTLRVFRTETPYRKKMTGDYFLTSGVKVSVEILADGQQFAAFHIHPDTGQPYHWPKDSILDFPVHELPILSEEEATEIIELCKCLFESMGAQSTAENQESKARAGRPSESHFEQEGDLLAISSAVAAIPNNNCSYDDWLKMLCAIKGALGEAGKSLFLCWSANSTKNNAEYSMNKWEHETNSVKSGAGSIYKKAQENGWNIPNHISFNPEKLATKLQSLKYAEVSESKILADAAAGWPEPVDPFGDFPCPKMTKGLLPKTVERFSFTEAEIIGVDPAAVSLAALVSCAAMISDTITIQPKEHDTGWQESARLWSIIVGAPSTKKSPAISAATQHVKKIYSKSYAHYQEKMNDYENEQNPDHPDETEEIVEPKLPRRLYANDTTIEAMQDILSQNTDGLLLELDELSGWIGSMEKYSSGKGPAADRAFWLSSWNGGPYQVDRVVRGSTYIPNLSVNIIGGIQPDVIAKDAKKTPDDGLMQRFLPIILDNATVGEDTVFDESIRSDFSSLIIRLCEIQSPISDDGETQYSVKFSKEAQEIRRQFEQHSFDLTKTEDVSTQFSAWSGKLNGMFARMCLTFHCIQAVETNPFTLSVPHEVEAGTAKLVDNLFRKFLIPHGLRFYCSVLEKSTSLVHAKEIAGLILSKDWQRIVRSDLAQNYRPAKSAEQHEVDKWMMTLESFGWLEAEQMKGSSRVKSWLVNPRTHEMFAEQAKREQERRKEKREIVLNNISGFAN